MDLGNDLLANWLPEGAYTSSCLGLLRTRIDGHDVLFAGCRKTFPWQLQYNRLDLTLCGERTRIENHDGKLTCRLPESQNGTVPLSPVTMQLTCSGAAVESGSGDGVFPDSVKVPGRGVLPGLYLKNCAAHWRLDNVLVATCYEDSPSGVPIITHTLLLAAECLPECQSTILFTRQSQQYSYDLNAAENPFHSHADYYTTLACAANVIAPAFQLDRGEDTETQQTTVTPAVCRTPVISVTSAPDSIPAPTRKPGSYGTALHPQASLLSMVMLLAVAAFSE